jgi:hypothetical protein
MVPRTEAVKVCRSVRTPTRVVENHINGGNGTEDRNGKTCRTYGALYTLLLFVYRHAAPMGLVLCYNY